VWLVHERVEGLSLSALGTFMGCLKEGVLPGSYLSRDVMCSTRTHGRS
jgi:hypothetical protein